jgi:hypothetical protein
LWLRIRPLAAERPTKENVPWDHPGSAASAIDLLVRKAAVGNPGWTFGTSVVVTRCSVSKADDSRATKAAVLAATVLTIIARTIDDVSTASVSA